MFSIVGRTQKECLREKVGGGTSLWRVEMKKWPIEHILVGTLFSVALAIKIDSYIKIIHNAHIRNVSYDSNQRQAQIY